MQVAQGLRRAWGFVVVGQREWSMRGEKRQWLTPQRTVHYGATPTSDNPRIASCKSTGRLTLTARRLLQARVDGDPRGQGEEEESMG